MRTWFSLLILILTAGVAQSGAVTNSRPNFLVILTDDQRWDAIGAVQRELGAAARFPWLQTPHLDRLAADGVRFRHAFVTSALGSPSRAAFLTGRYNHLNGIANNRTPFPLTNATYASLLRAAGYITGYIGKWHMGNQKGHRAGFDFSASFTGQGRFTNALFELNGNPVTTEGWVDDVATDYALQFIRDNREERWLLVVGYRSPQVPSMPPPRLADRYEDEKADVPPNVDVVPPYVRKEKFSRPRQMAQSGQANLDYFRCVTGVDENLGRLLGLLDELKLAENTMVVYVGDSGFLMGEHGLGDKRAAYEDSIRIPLVVRFPRLNTSHKVVDEFALNIDLAPTLLDFAGVLVPPDMQGRSWRPLLEGRSTLWRQSFFYEYFCELSNPIPLHTAVRTAGAKLVKYPGHEAWTEFYDLKADPYETNNLAGSADHKAMLNQLLAEHDRLAKAADYRVPEYADNPAQEPPPPVRLNAFVLDYDFAKDQEHRVMDASGQGNHATSTNTTVVEGRRGRMARQFDGAGHVEVPSRSGLNPAQGPWTVEAVFKAESPNGVVLARGGQPMGYALHLVDGRPAFSLRVNNNLNTVYGRQPCTGVWVHVTAVISGDYWLTLYVNGRQQARRGLNNLLVADPVEAMQLGADLGSSVTANTNRTHFIGLMERVRIYSGERSEEDIRADAKASLPARGRP